MKLILLITLLLPIFLVQAEGQDYSKIEKIINQNSNQLQNEEVSIKDPLEKKRAFDIAQELQTNVCPSSIDKKLTALVVNNLVLKDVTLDKAKKAFDCIESIGFKAEENYTLMVDLLPLWKANNKILEQFYTRFFKGYKKPNVSVLGLLDNAKLMCANEAISYLEKESYPANFDKSMSTKEYALFLNYIKEYRCDGY